MDAISIHAYPYELNVGRDWSYYQGIWSNELQQYKQFGKPFWITETGLQSTQLSEADQANYLKTAYTFFQAQGASGFIWYQLRDYPGASDTLGLLRADESPKPSYTTYKAVIKAS